MIAGENIDLRRFINIRYSGAGERVCQLNLLEKMSVKWQQVGDLVGMSPAKLEGIENKELRDNEKCMRCVIIEWMRSYHTEVSELKQLATSDIMSS